MVGIVGVGSVNSDGMSNLSTSESGRRHGLGRHTTLAVISAGLIISVTVFFAVRQQTITHLADSLGIQAGRTTETIQRRIRVVEDTARALGAHVSSSSILSADEFSGFVSHVLPEGSGVDLLFWTSLSTGGMTSSYSVGALAGEEHLAVLDNSAELRTLIAAALAGRPLTTVVIDGRLLGIA